MKRYITGVWTRWSDGEIEYWKGEPWGKKSDRSVTDRLDLSGLKRCSAWVTRSVTRLADRLRQIIAKVF